MRLLKRWKGRTLVILAVVGPGIITANVDNDAGGILTYSQAGARFGHLLLWTMIPVTLALIVVQEMSARMGAVTGKGLSDLIREEFGVRAHPLWKDAAMATIKPPSLHAFREQAYLFIVIGVVGTTIAPWMQFYLQSSIVEKGVTVRGLKASRWDVITGCIFTDVVAWFIIVTCAATLFV